MKTCLAVLLAVATMGCLPVVAAEKPLPKVLIIGDSISIGYTDPVTRLLAGKADVKRVPDNCQSTVYALEHIRQWIGEEHWDVIHFNWGIWDMHHLDDWRIRTTPVEYERNLRRLVDILKSTKARLIWASTTPVRTSSTGWWVSESDIPRYNAVAARVMRDNAIPVDDLYSVILPKLSELRTDDGCHYKPEGSEFLAQSVAKSILAALESAR